ncbi:MAG: GNAT family N-acetyltransferase [Breznakibacter sp.]
MEPIMEPVDREKLIMELTPKRFLRNTLRGNNQIYRFNYRESPLLMFEVGRLRELSFRKVDCGTGKALDIDDYDIEPKGYHQLIVWNPRDKEIIGGYRYAMGHDYLDCPDELSMSHYFKLSKRFVAHCLPYSIELGRAWVNPLYQPDSSGRKSIFALDNLWEGIGAVLSENPEVRYLYGKVTISPNYHPVGRALILWLLNNYFKDPLHLVTPVKPIALPDVRAIAGIGFKKSDFSADYKRIATFLRDEGLQVPPLISAYLGLSSKITTFGVAYNKEMGYAFETGMMLKVADIHRDKFERYVGQVKKTVVNQPVDESILD